MTKAELVKKYNSGMRWAVMDEKTKQFVSFHSRVDLAEKRIKKGVVLKNIGVLIESLQ